MYLEIGDSVIHWSFGPGTVIAIEEKLMAGAARQYYVLDLLNFKIWVPVEEAIGGSLRSLADSSQFNRLFDILRIPGQTMSDSNTERRNVLTQRMYKSTLEELCRIIRELTDRSRQKKLTESDKTVLSNAKRRLLDEWVLTFKINRKEAQDSMDTMLLEGM